MQLKFSGQYKSLNSFEFDIQSDLCIITGINGSGKSQFLDLFKYKRENNQHVNLEIIPALNKIQIEGLPINTIPSMSGQEWKERIDAYLLPIRQFGVAFLIILDFLVEKKVEHRVIRGNY